MQMGACTHRVAKVCTRIDNINWDVPAAAGIKVVFTIIKSQTVTRSVVLRDEDKLIRCVYLETEWGVGDSWIVASARPARLEDSGNLWQIHILCQKPYFTHARAS